MIHTNVKGDILDYINNYSSQPQDKTLIVMHQANCFNTLHRASGIAGVLGNKYPQIAYADDTFGDIIGREFGFTKHMHYRPYDNSNLSATLRKKGIKGQHLTHAETDHGRNEINKLLNGRYQDNIVGNLQGRNYYQVVNSRAVFCISKIVGMASISGGTNTAFQLAIRMNKLVYVYDVEVFGWYQYSYITHQLESMGGETPVLTKEYAIVGTRDIEDYHIKNKATNQWGSRPNYLGDKTSRIVQEAIRDFYRVTLAAI